MNKRDRLLNLIHAEPGNDGYTPAAFFLHFGPDYQAGQAAIDRHLEFFRYTGMDFVKIQYEQAVPPAPPVRRPQDWASLPRVDDAFFEPTIRVVEGLIKAAKDEALVLLTLYSTFMWARHFAGQSGESSLAAHLGEDPAAVQQGLEIVTENVRRLVRLAKAAGVDGFYASSQGGEAFRFSGTDFFARYIKPTDLAVWEEIGDSPFNILHVCDYEGSYDDLTPFLDYPGQVVNASLQVGGRRYSPREMAELFGRPFMGGLERKGILATGAPDEARQTVHEILAWAPERFILAADCTVPSETPWENLKAAIDAAHGQYMDTGGYI